MKERRAGLLLVMIDIDPAHEQEFNDWYEKEHLPERLACPGFITAKRFVAAEGEPKYLAIYDLESPDVLRSSEYMKIYEPSEWTRRISQHFRNIVRNVYVELLPPKNPAPDPRSRFQPRAADQENIRG